MVDLVTLVSVLQTYEDEGVPPSSNQPGCEEVVHHRYVEAEGDDPVQKVDSATEPVQDWQDVHSEQQRHHTCIGTTQFVIIVF